LRHDDARIGAERPVREGGRVAVGDEADPRRFEALLVGHLMNELVHAGIALLHGGIVEELEAIEPAQREVREPGLTSQITRLMMTVSTIAAVKLTLPK
jgi:hypothetical protein